MFSPDEIAPQGIRPISRGEYDRLVELGMFIDERLELLRGMLVTMSPQGEDHAGLTFWLAKRLTLALGEQWEVRSQLPYAATDDSEPEPDVSVSPASENPRFAHPSNAVLVIEVSDSSLRIDRRIKAPIYAGAGVPEYWIVDISSSELVVVVHTEPAPDGYRRVETLRANDVLRPAKLPGIEIPVSDFPAGR
jgi:Uma2 family endonuclease